MHVKYIVILDINIALNESIYAQGYGGDSYIMRVSRALFQARSSLEDMWQGNPVLTSLLFGLPLGFLSLIMYSICCTDIMDANEDDEIEGQEENYQSNANKGRTKLNFI